MDFNGARGQMVVMSGKWVNTRPPQCIKCDEIQLTQKNMRKIRELLDEKSKETIRNLHHSPELHSCGSSAYQVHFSTWYKGRQAVGSRGVIPVKTRTRTLKCEACLSNMHRVGGQLLTKLVLRDRKIDLSVEFENKTYQRNYGCFVFCNSKPLGVKIWYIYIK